MALDLTRFIQLRPKLYHLTASHNAERIQKMESIHSASHLLAAAGQERAIGARRPEGILIQCQGDQVHIRDQSPLHRGNISFEAGWDFEDLVRYLNNHVFFWPGNPERPIGYGLRHFQRYAQDDVVVLSFDTRELFEANQAPGPMFSKYNSGSPRCNGGRGSPRGPSTFTHAQEFLHRPSQVVEVTFPLTADLSNCSIEVNQVTDLIG